MTPNSPAVAALLLGLLGTSLGLPPPALNTTSPAPCRPPCPSPEALFPHPHDCSAYFHCAHDYPYLRYCPEGQQFWAAEQRCDWPQFAQCEASPDAPCEAVTVPSATTESVPSASSGAPANCAPPCPFSGAYMPHPQDCTKFYTCAGAVAFVNDCQPGLHYNMEKMWCDYPDQANCIAGPDHACDEFLTP